jgi:hypothetical protein
MLNGANDVLVNEIKKELEDRVEKILSARSYIKGPVEIGMVSWSEPASMSHPLLKLIEVKDRLTYLQSSTLSTYVTRECFHKDMYALFYAAISHKTLLDQRAPTVRAFR